MTQSPGSGSAAPRSTDPASESRTERLSLGSNGTSATRTGPGPNGASANGKGGNSANGAGWGSTSTSPGTSPALASGAPGTSAPPLTHADAPTATVPQIRDVPTVGSGNPGSPGPARGETGPDGPSGPPGGPAGRPVRQRGPRRARLQLRHINPFTVLKFSCVLAIALFFVWLIFVGVLYGVLDGAGVIGRINDAYTTIKGDGSDAPVGAGVVFGTAAIIGLVNIILFIALSTIGSVIYNLCADLVGGVEVTLSER